MSQLSEDQLDEMIDRERFRETAPLNDWRTIAARAREENLALAERLAALEAKLAGDAPQG